MNKRTTDCLAYLTLAGTILAFFLGDRKACRLHLNQGFVLNVLFVVCYLLITTFKIPLVGQIVMLVALVFLVLGLSHAVKGEDKPLPLIGRIQILR